MDNKARPDSTVGTITEALPNALFRVSVAGKDPILAYLSGKMRLNRIKVLVGDSVDLILDPYGGRARIVRRLDNRRNVPPEESK